MKRYIVPAIAAALLFRSALASAAPDDKTPRSEIESQYARVRQAFRQKDMSILESVIAPGFRATDLTSKDGRPHTITRGQTIKGWRGWFAVLKQVESQSHTIKSLKVDGSRAVAMVDWALTFTEDQGARGLRHASIHGPCRDTWARYGNGWKLLHWENIGPQTISEHTEKRH
jgi:hypothetical protein